MAADQYYRTRRALSGNHPPSECMLPHFDKGHFLPQKLERKLIGTEIYLDHLTPS